MSGVVVVSDDGSARVQGQCGGVAFSSPAGEKVWRDWDGAYHFDTLLADGDLLIGKKTWIPIKLVFWGTNDDANDGDETDDSVGDIGVKSQTGMGKGAVGLTG